MASKVEHIARFAVQDWRTSKVRARSARTQDPMLRVVYLEIIFALYEAGGELPADPECLADILLLPAEDVARCLPILAKLGESGRGGVVISDAVLRNARVDEDLAAAASFREAQSRKGQLRHKPRLNTGSAVAEQRLDSAQPIPVPKPLPLPQPSPVVVKSTDKPSSAGGETDEPSAPQPVPLLTFPCQGEPATWVLTQEQVDEWSSLYPGVGILAEARRALAWVKAQPGKERTARGMKKFLVNWFGKAVDRGYGQPRDLPLRPAAPPPVSLKVLQGQVEDIYRERFRAGHMAREALDASIAEVRATQDREALYKTLDEMRTDRPVRILTTGEAVL